MTVQPDLIDPYEAFWAQARGTSADLTPAEEAQVVSISNRGRNSDLAEISLALGAAFLFYKGWMRRQLKKDLPPEPSMLRLAANALWSHYVPIWAYTVVPAIVSGYLAGAKEVGNNQVSQEYLQAIAEKYALDLGQHLHDVSTEALVQGYSAQVNRKVPPARAIDNSLKAFGVTPRAANALVNVWISEDPKRLTSVPMLSIRDQRAKKIIDADVQQRARQIGETESWTAKSTGKQIVWMYGVQTGLLPENAQRTWVTAKDEKVCPVCGPLHKRDVAVGEKFETANGKLWSPPAHPRCRCDVILKVKLSAEDRLRPVAKNFKGDPFDRDRRGRFARVEQRTTYADPRPVNADIQRLYREAKERFKEPEKERPEVGSGRPMVGRPAVGGKPLGGKPVLGTKPELTGEKLDKKPLDKKSVGRSSLANRVLGNTRPELGTPPKSDNPNYFELDQPLFAVVPTWHFEETMMGQAPGNVFIGDDIDFMSNYLQVTKDIAEHWRDVAAEKMNAIDEEGPSGRIVPISHNGQIIMAKVDRDIIEDAFWAELSDDPSLMVRQVEAEYEDPSGNVRLISVSNTELSEHFGFSDYIDEFQPHLVIVKHGQPGVTEINRTKNGDYGINPGVWKIARQAPGGGSERRFQRVWLAPPD